jgi:hypothetical protein
MRGQREWRDSDQVPTFEVSRIKPSRDPHHHLTHACLTYHLIQKHFLVTGLTKAGRSNAAIALDPIPASKATVTHS